MVSEEAKQSPQDQKNPNSVSENGPIAESLFSPRFKSVAAMAGWDEEAILVAALVVEDTPDRECKHKKRSELHFKTPPSNSRRKRRAQRTSPLSVPVAVLDLDEEESGREENDKKKVEVKEKNKKEEKKVEENEQCSAVSCSNSVLPCMDKLREELSCAVCLEICYEPSTTTCGHSFCKKCLRSAADKCGRKCPKCRQLISNGRSCTVNTVLWNSIQLLFPQEIEARKAAAALNGKEAEHQSPQRVIYNNVSTRRMRPSVVSIRDESMRRREIPSQEEDSSLARRLGRENLALLLSRASSNSLEDEHQCPQRIHNNVRTRVSSMRRRRMPSQDEDAALARRLGRENLALLLSRASSNGLEDEHQCPQRIHNNVRTRVSSMRKRRMPSQDEDAALALRLERENLARAISRETSARRGSSQDEDAELAMRLQREEFMVASRGTNEQSGRSVSLARANLRAMASRAITNRIRGHPL